MITPNHDTPTPRDPNDAARATNTFFDSRSLAIASLVSTLVVGWAFVRHVMPGVHETIVGPTKHGGVSQSQPDDDDVPTNHWDGLSVECDRLWRLGVSRQALTDADAAMILASARQHYDDMVRAWALSVGSQRAMNDALFRYHHIDEFADLVRLAWTSESAIVTRASDAAASRLASAGGRR
jgi:hypothetical protein